MTSKGSTTGRRIQNAVPATHREPVAPLAVSANRWISPTVHSTDISDVDSADVVDRKLRALLNKLTNQNFDSISDQIIAWINASKNEKDGHTLIQVIKLIFEQMTDEATWSETHARLCRMMVERISPQVRMDGNKSPEGKPLAGGQLFRKCLLIRCQDDLERGWVARQPISLDECYAASKEKRRGLGLVKFVGELFKLQMLTERIVHECIKKFLGSTENLNEAGMENVCQLMMIVGQLLDTPKAKAHMDVYFTRMKELCKNPKVSWRLRFKLQDVIELRDQKWIAPGAAIARKTIRCPRSFGFQAAKEKAGVEAQSYQRQLDLNMLKGRSTWGGSDRNPESSPIHWTTAGSSAVRPQLARDLPQFGKISKATFARGSGGVSIEEENIFHSLSWKSSNADTTSKSPEAVVGCLGDALEVTPVEPIISLGTSANCWIALSTIRKPSIGDASSPEVVDQKIKVLLNKLTTENFDSISDQIIAWANQSEKEKDGRTLVQVTRLVLEKATDEAARSEMYARLCRKMMERVSPEVQDVGIRNAEGKPITGGQLFRKYLLNRCQEDFERGWVAKETTAAAAAAKASDDQVIKAVNEKKGDEGELYSDEYYVAQKAKRQGLGLIKFIGELFKLQMLTERIIHECVKKLLGNVESPEEEEIESLCQLLKTVGQLLDVPKARAYMDVYFTRMKELCKSPNVSPRMQFVLQDVIELRDRKWVARGTVIAPTTISAVHEAAAKEKAAADAQSYQRQISMSRGGSRRGGERNVESGPDGWTIAGSSVARPQPKAGDLSQFGKISKAATIVMSPSSVFARKDPKHDSLSRTSSSSNMFSMLSQNPELAIDVTAKSSRPPIRKPSVDLGQGGTFKVHQRKKLQLLPRTKPSLAKEISRPASEVKPKAPAYMSKAESEKIDESVKEFFAVRSLEDADAYFTNLPAEYRFRLVDKLVATALESKEADAVLVSEFFFQAASKGQCSLDVFEAGFMPMAECLDDIAIGAPMAFKFMAIMLRGAGFDENEERLLRIAHKSMDGDKLIQLVSW